MLYQVATGLLEPGNVAYPVRTIAREYGFGFREAHVESIDLDRRRVSTTTGPIAYDYLVLTLGSTTNYFGNDSIREHALSLKSLRDAVVIRNRVVECFERADADADENTRRALLTFVVVGGGATGIELTGSLHTLIHNGLLPDYPRINPSEVRVIVVEAGPKPLAGMDPWLGENAHEHLERKGIELRASTPATSVTEEGIGLKDGTFIPSRTVVWAAGVRPTSLTAALDVEKGRDGRLVVDEMLRLPAHQEAFVLGDCAWFRVPENDNRPAPPNAQTAVRQARVVAKNLAATVRGEPLTPFTYKNEGNLVALGQGDGVALLGSVHLEGFAAWLVWRGFYLNQLMGFKNRLQVLVEWTAAYFGQRSTTRLDVLMPAEEALPQASTRDASRAARASSPLAAPAPSSAPAPLDVSVPAPEDRPHDLTQRAPSITGTERT
jgi:NADH dehydrogenase